MDRANTPEHLNLDSTPEPSPEPIQRLKAQKISPITHSSPPLSPTERKVYDLLLKHMTERQVAQNLDRSHNTIHVHVRNIYRKLGVRTRQQLLTRPYEPALPTAENL